MESLCVWESRSLGLPEIPLKILLPHLQGELPRRTAQRHFEEFKKYYHELGSPNFEPDFEKDVFVEYREPSSIRSRVSFAVIANRAGHMSLRDPFFLNFYQSFTRAGAQIFVVPLGLEKILSPGRLNRFHRALSAKFPALLSLGGGDIDPRLYGDEQFHPSVQKTYPERDEVELHLIRNYRNMKNGVFYGICRGHQAYCVALGGKLHQDLSLQGREENHHSLKSQNHDGTVQSAWHWVHLADEKNALFEAIGQRSFLVNSRHHQSVKIEDLSTSVGCNLRLIAYEGSKEDAVVEALEERDEQGQVRALTLQFHPEDMHVHTMDDRIHEHHADRIIRWMVSNARSLSLRRTKLKKLKSA